MSNRSIPWSVALRDLRDDRATRHPVREERLRTTAGLPGAPGLPLSAWRGLSGRRYVVAVLPLAPEALDERLPAVVIAVRRGDIGPAVLVAVEAFEPGAAGLPAFLAAARAERANELHVHRLADTAAERAAIVRDLREPAVAPA